MLSCFSDHNITDALVLSQQDLLTIAKAWYTPLRLQALQVPADRLRSAIACAKQVYVENNLLDFITLALGQMFRVLHGHKVCLHMIFEAGSVILCIVGLTTFLIGWSDC